MIINMKMVVAARSVMVTNGGSLLRIISHPSTSVTKRNSATQRISTQYTSTAIQCTPASQRILTTRLISAVRCTLATQGISASQRFSTTQYTSAMQYTSATRRISTQYTSTATQRTPASQRISTTQHTSASQRISRIQCTSTATQCTSASQHTSTTTTPKENSGDEQQKPLKSVYEIPNANRYPRLGFFLYTLINILTKYGMAKKMQENMIQMTKDVGPIMRIYSLFQPNTVLTTRPEDFKVLMKATMKNPINPGMKSARKIMIEADDNYFEGKTGLFGNGDEWWRVRSRVQTPLMRPKNIETYIESMDLVTLQFMDRMSSLQNQHGEMPEDFRNELQKWALESLALVAVNRRLGCLAPELPPNSEPMKMIKLVNEIMDLFGVVEIYNPMWQIYPTKAFKQLKAKHKQFLKLTDATMQQGADGVLSGLAEDKENDFSMMKTLLNIDGLSRKDVVAVMMSLFMAGVHTTATSLAFTLYLLARHPEKQVQLQQEVDAVLAGHKGPLTQKHLANMPYLKAVVKESLRLFPVTLGIARLLEEDLEMNGYLIPKGAMQRFNIDYKYKDMEVVFNLLFTPSTPLKFNIKERF